MEFRAMHKFGVLFLALIACHLVLSVEGRQLKSVSKNDSKQSSHSAMQKEDHNQPAVPSYNPSVAQQSVSGRKEVLPPPAPTKGSDFAVDKENDDFRPTTPGNSPGVGHSFTEDDEDVEQKPGSIKPSINGKHSTAGDKEDFRPTNPGHSPGVGHILSKPKF